ncbi:MAG: MBL fold metallo-hydrolase [Acidobacteriota bacterium]
MVRPRSRSPLFLVPAVGVLALGASNLCCARRLGSVHPTPADAPYSAASMAAGDELELRFLGVAGWTLRRGSAMIMTGPFYSNPSFLRTGLLTIESKPEIVDRFLPDVSDAQAILVGHAHYDHLMDVPYVARAKATHATIYGSKTMAHILAAVPELRGRVQEVETRASDGERPGEWVYTSDRAIRFMAMKSEHAPHFFGIKLYGGTLDRDLAELPRRAGGWKEGQTLSYCIDFLDPDGTIAFRVHFQDSASNAPIGMPPAMSGRDAKDWDAVIFTGASFHEVKGYPETLLMALHPRRAFMSHWEDFFIPHDAPLHVVRATNVAKLCRRLEGKLPRGTELVVSLPGATYRMERSR